MANNGQGRRCSNETYPREEKSKHEGGAALSDASHTFLYIYAAGQALASASRQAKSPFAIRQERYKCAALLHSRCKPIADPAGVQVATYRTTISKLLPSPYVPSSTSPARSPSSNRSCNPLCFSPITRAFNALNRAPSLHRPPHPTYE